MESFDKVKAFLLETVIGFLLTCFVIQIKLRQSQSLSRSSPPPHNNPYIFNRLLSDTMVDIRREQWMFIIKIAFSYISLTSQAITACFFYISSSLDKLYVFRSVQASSWQNGLCGGSREPGSIPGDFKVLRELRALVLRSIHYQKLGTK